MRQNALMLILFVASRLCADDAGALYDKAMALLNESQTEHSKLVPAIKLLTEAAKRFEETGNTERAVAVNASLYWAKKRMMLSDTEDLKPSSDVVKRLDIAAAPVPVSQSKIMLERAEKFARANTSDQLSIAMLYFEIADRFPDTEDGRRALKLSLSAMQNAKVKTITAAVDIKFENGWNIYIDGKDVDHKTPCTIEVPLGSHSIVLVKEGFIDIPAQISVREYQILELRQIPQRGKSVTLTFIAEKFKEQNKEVIGIWHGKHPNWTSDIDFKPDGTFKQLSVGKIGGKWQLDGDTLILSWSGYSEERLKKVDKNLFIGKNTTIKR